MIALVSLFVIVIVSIIIVRIGAIALELTGIPHEIAAFQAQSAFSGTGFTTSEAEVIVNHVARRRIIRLLIMLGSAGLTSSIATLIVAFVGQSGQEFKQRGIVLFAGLFAVFIFARSKVIYKFMQRIITVILQKHSNLNIVDYNEILGLGKGYGISTFKVKDNSWLIGRTLKSLAIRAEGILVLTIKRKTGEKYELIGAPTADVKIAADDELVCYGKAGVVKDLADRLKGKAGDMEHFNVVNAEKETAENEIKAVE